MAIFTETLITKHVRGVNLASRPSTVVLCRVARPTIFRCRVHRARFLRTAYLNILSFSAHSHIVSPTMESMPLNLTRILIPAGSFSGSLVIPGSSRLCGLYHWLPLLRIKGTCAPIDIVKHGCWMDTKSSAPMDAGPHFGDRGGCAAAGPINRLPYHHSMQAHDVQVRHLRGPARTSNV